MNRICAKESLPSRKGGMPMILSQLYNLPAPYPWMRGNPLTSSALYFPPRESIQLVAFINGSPCLSPATVTAHMLVVPMATFCVGTTPDSFITCLTPLEITCHHSNGTCSAPPLGKKRVSSRPLPNA